MGSLQEAVLQYVEGELRKDPRVKNVALFAGAREIDASVGELTMQQFHGKYRLPATRRIAPPPRPARRPKPVPAPAPAAAAGDPSAVRRLLLDLAKELANAENQADTIEVMVRLDDYVADIVKAAQG